MRRPLALALALALLSAPPKVPAQEAPGTASGAAPPPAEQVAGALLAAPAALRDAATVLGRDGTPRPGDVLSTLRAGDGALVCLADDPGAEGFEVSCYHRDLDPYMALGRALRAEGADRRRVMEARYAALEAGEIRMPAAATLYSLAAPAPPAPGVGERLTDARRLTVVYLPFATVESTGLPAEPGGDAPWLMLPGTPWAHIMIPG